MRSSGPGSAHARVTRDVDPEMVSDLYASAARKCLSFAVDGSASVLPVDVRRDTSGLFVRAIHAGDVVPAPGTEVVVLVDAGEEWFDLRAIYVRASVVDLGSDGWSKLDPHRTAAWDYGRIRRDR